MGWMEDGSYATMVEGVGSEMVGVVVETKIGWREPRGWRLDGGTQGVRCGALRIESG